MSYEWLRFVDLDRIATDEEREKLMKLFCYTYVNTWKARLQKYTFREILLYYATYIENVELMRFVFDLGVCSTKPFGFDGFNLEMYACEHKTIELLIDMGIDVDISLLEPFKHSRNAARLGAIVVMGAIRGRYAAAPEPAKRALNGMKDISRIIGRLVWESRKYYLSEELPILSKRIKNE